MSDPKIDIDISPGEKEGERTVLEIRVYYSKGGTNYFSYKQEPRGYYVMVRPCNVGECFRTYQLTPGSNKGGFKQILETTKRLNRKRLEFYQTAVDEYLDRDAVLAHHRDGNNSEVFVEIMRAIERREAA